jgi:hypothetical protein
VPRGAGVELERQVAEQLDEGFEVDVAATYAGFAVELVDRMRDPSRRRAPTCG